MTSAEGPDRDKCRQRHRVAGDLMFAEQPDVLSPVDRPVVLLDRGVVGLGGEEHKVGEQPRASPVAVDERMDADGLGMDGDAEHARRPCRRVLPALADRVETGTQFDGNLLGRHPEVEFSGAEAAGPGPDVPIEPAVDVAEEVIGQ